MPRRSGVIGTPALKTEAVRTFAAAQRGDVLQAGHPGYDDARALFNAMIDRRPALIVRCEENADVQRALEFARAHGLLVAVRGGGHNVAGKALCDDGMVIDLSRMKRIEVDPAARTARAGGGLTWGEFDAATQEHGLATTGGFISTTGIAGLTLGGGLGWLMRKHGLSCDNLRSVEIVTADGPRPDRGCHRASRSVLGRARRRGELRGRDLLRVRTPPGGPADSPASSSSRSSRPKARSESIAISWRRRRTI